MSRLTPKDWENPCHEIWFKLGNMHTRYEPFKCFLSQALRKLAHYEDLEEQGLLCYPQPELNDCEKCGCVTDDGGCVFFGFIRCGTIEECRKRMAELGGKA